MDLNKLHYVVATAIIIKDGKYLITRRALTEKICPGQWTVPGGKLHFNEYSKKIKDTSLHWYNVLENLVKREVLEEVNLNIKNLRYLTSAVYVRPDGIPTVLISFIADYDSGKINLCKDLTEFAWINLNEAKDYQLIEGIYEELEMLDNYLDGQGITEWKK